MSAQNGKMTETELRQLLAGGSFSVLTASNPCSESRGEQENQARNRELGERLRKEGYDFFSAHGKYDGKVEEAFVVMHPSPPQASGRHRIEALAREFDQESVLHVERGKNELISLKPGNQREVQ